jgi:TRAP-type mannitol/chloroaromatic compound transport system permease small subunit
MLLDRWLGWARLTSRFAARCGGAMILASALLVSGDVIIRKLFAVSVGGSDEISGYAFAIATSWGLAFTLLERANVRVDALYGHLTRPVTAVLDLAALLALGLFIGMLTWFAGMVLQDSLLFATRATTPLATPLWIPQGLWLIGFGLFLFAWVPLVLRVALALLAGDLALLRQLAGARTLEEDAADEAAHAKKLQSAAVDGGAR